MIGQAISHYRILEELGRGGIGVVYKAHDTKLDRPAALKVLRSELLQDEEHRLRFLREARSAAAVTHPYIASIYDAGEADGTLFIAMEFVEGKTLRGVLSKGPLPIPEAHQYATEIAEGLVTAHQANLVHRDLKPDNVMLAKNGHVRILDFGLAKVVEKRDEAATVTLGRAKSSDVTTQGAILGTPAYMSPEQARGEPVDSRSDIFSFGCTVYEMVTGRGPFQHKTHTETLASILRDEPLSPHDSNLSVPVELSRIITRCLHKKPEDRYNDTRDLVAALKDLHVISKAQTQPHPFPVQQRKPWKRLVAGIAALAAILTLALVYPWKRAQTPEEPDVYSNSSATGRPNWILVGDFDGPDDDTSLAEVARELLSTALHQSMVVTPISSAQMRRGLELAGRGDTTRVVGDIAQELAFRAGAARYIEGRVDRIASGLSIIVRVFDTESGESLASFYELAMTEEDFLPAIERIGRSLHKTVGLMKQEQEFPKVSIEAVTPSLDAYKLFLGAFRLRSLERKEQEAQVLLRHALAIDPKFALAWKELGLTYWNRGFLDSAAVAFKKALRFPDRLTLVQRLMIEGRIAAVEYDHAAAIQKYSLVLNQDPHSFSAMTNRANSCRELGLYEEALHDFVNKERFEPFAPPRLVDQQYGVLLQLGRFDAAKDLITALLPKHAVCAELMASTASSQWSRAESIVTRVEQSSTALPVDRFRAGLTAASLLALKGSVQEAIEQLQQLAVRQNVPGWQDDLTQNSWEIERLRPCFTAVNLTLALRGEYHCLFLEAANDTTVASMIYRGLCEVAKRNLNKAREYTVKAQSMPERDQRRFAGDLRVLRAWIAAYEGNWSQSAALIGARPRDESLPNLSGTLPLRWIFAEASEQEGELDQAVESFDRIVSSPRIMQREFFVRGMPHSFAHHRLVLLYSRMGRVKDARRHWEILEKTFTNPDPELVPMIEEARQALAEAEAKL